MPPRAISVFVSLGAYSLLKFFELTFLSRKVSFIIRKVYVGMVFPERAKKLTNNQTAIKNYVKNKRTGALRAL